jgi:hypothetical protein
VDAACGRALQAVGIAVVVGDYRTNELVLSACFALPGFASALLFRHAAIRSV